MHDFRGAKTVSMAFYQPLICGEEMPTYYERMSSRRTNLRALTMRGSKEKVRFQATIRSAIIVAR
jgi:hypothetical protein